MHKVLLILILTAIGWQAIGQERPGGRRGSQIVDDSTKQIYGPKTTRYLNEAAIRTGRYYYTTIDTTVLDFHKKPNPVENTDFQLMDLGNIGTATRPVFFEMPDVIGLRPGFTLYDPYFKKNSDFLYYDTHSPYSWFSVFWGGEGRAVTQAGYSRNVNERFNFTLNYDGIVTDKRVGRARRGDRNALGIAYDFNLWYHSKNGKYVVLTNYSRNKQEVIEMGGVVLDTLRPERDYFDPQLSEPVLKTAKGIETRNNFHTYQYYKIHKLLRVYHSMDRGRQVNEFFVLPKNEQYAFYDHQELMVENDTVSDKSTFKYFTNEVGGAGVFGKFYYDLFYKIRDIDFNYNHLDSDSLGIPTQFYEFSRGFRAGGSLDSLNYVDLSGEYLNHGFYKINGDVTSEWVDVSVKKSLWEPAYMERGYQGHYDFWHNEFRAMSALQGEAALKVKVKGLLFKPGVRYTAINDNIFFRKQSFNDSTLVDSVGLQQVLPVQADSVSTIFSPGIELKYTLSNITLTTRATYSILNKHAEEGVPTPKIFLYGQLAYHNIFFKGNLELHAGIDLHWRSSYYAPMYDPLIQQFYVQDEYEWKNYWMMNVFINAKISKVRTFIRLNNIRMNFNDVGYYALPMYPGVNNILDVGFDWKFYD